MAITKPTKKTSIDAFIAGAPDNEAISLENRKPKYVRKGKKIQITLTISETLLEQVNQLSDQLSLTRAAVINLAIHQGIEHGINVESLIKRN
jgi:hypothetical protein